MFGRNQVSIDMEFVNSTTKKPGWQVLNQSCILQMSKKKSNKDWLDKSVFFILITSFATISWDVENIWDLHLRREIKLAKWGISKNYFKKSEK